MCIASPAKLRGGERALSMPTPQPRSTRASCFCTGRGNLLESYVRRGCRMMRVSSRLQSMHVWRLLPWMKWEVEFTTHAIRAGTLVAFWICPGRFLPPQFTLTPLAVETSSPPDPIVMDRVYHDHACTVTWPGVGVEIYVMPKMNDLADAYALDSRDVYESRRRVTSPHKGSELSTFIRQLATRRVCSGYRHMGCAVAINQLSIVAIR